jgi:hypothetical protein
MMSSEREVFRFIELARDDARRFLETFQHASLAPQHFQSQVARELETFRTKIPKAKSESVIAQGER